MELAKSTGQVRTDLQPGGALPSEGPDLHGLDSVVDSSTGLIGAYVASNIGALGVDGLEMLQMSKELKRVWAKRVPPFL